jgi:hypothetical protein
MAGGSSDAPPMPSTICCTTWSAHPRTDARSCTERSHSGYRSSVPIVRRSLTSLWQRGGASRPSPPLLLLPASGLHGASGHAVQACACPGHLAGVPTDQAASVGRGTVGRGLWCSDSGGQGDGGRAPPGHPTASPGEERRRAIDLVCLGFVPKSPAACGGDLLFSTSR